MQPAANPEPWAPAPVALPPGPDAVLVYRFPLLAGSEEDIPLDRFRALLSDEERTRADRFRMDLHRTRFTVARATLRLLLGAILQQPPEALVLLAEANGKPYLPGHPLHFNLSHSADLALLAVSGSRRLGVDVEEIRAMTDIPHLARNFTPEESLRFQPDAVPQLPPRSFFECWTRKEAVMKATGHGLLSSLSGFAVSFYPDPEVILRSGTEDVSQWLLYDLAPAQGYSGALAVERSPPPATITCWDATQLRDRLIAR